MHVILYLAIALVLSLARPALGQEWEEHVFIEDGFAVNFPGKPQIENTTWMSENEYKLPTRIYRASKGQERYSVTVVDYRPLEQMGIDRWKECPRGAEACLGGNQTADGTLTGAEVTGPGYWKMDSRGAMAFAVFRILKRPGVSLGEMTFQFVSVVAAYVLDVTNPDKSRTYATVSMHENRLYIFEATVPPNSIPPVLFQNSGNFVDEQGRGIRYQDYYINGVHGLRQYPRPAYRAGGELVGTPPQAAPRPQRTETGK